MEARLQQADRMLIEEIRDVLDVDPPPPQWPDTTGRVGALRRRGYRIEVFVLLGPLVLWLEQDEEDRRVLMGGRVCPHCDAAITMSPASRADVGDLLLAVEECSDIRKETP